MTPSIPTPRITLSYILFLSLTYSTTIAADYFRDTTGNPVINGGSYGMIRDMMAPDEGPITWGTSNDSSKSCPIYVIQSHYDMMADNTNNIPSTTITFKSPLKSKFISLGEPIEIYFNTKESPCKNTLKWSVKRAEKPDLNAYYLVAGDDMTSYNKGFFKVVDSITGSFDYVYRLMYCFDDKSCLEVGNSNSFSSWEFMGIASDPMKINFWVLDFTVSKASS
ncbi:unnamed protein product [Amaranthus hypochondriacus]